MRGEVRREDLREVAPLGDEDHDERGRDDLAVRGGLARRRARPRRRRSSRSANTAPARNITATTASSARCGTRWKSPTPIVTAMTTCTRNAAGRAEPHGPRMPARREHERREHRLVGKLAEEDHREHGEHDRQVHPANLRDERRLRETPDQPSAPRYSAVATAMIAKLGGTEPRGTRSSRPAPHRGDRERRRRARGPATVGR